MMLFGIAAIIASLAFPLAVVLVARTFAQAAVRFAPQPQGAQPHDVAIPEDLMAFVVSYPDDWAQDETMRAIREKYAEHRDWDKVRTALGVAHLPRSA